MTLRIDNLANLSLFSSLDSSQNIINRSIERLSTGRRVNSAADDAAALSIINRLSSQIGGLDTASRNVSNAISTTQIADGALQESTDILLRARDLAVQAANGSLSDSQRQIIQTEVSQLKNEFSRIASSTNFAGKALLDGSFTSQVFQVGGSAGETIQLSLPDTAASAIGRFTIETSGLSGSLGAVSALGNTFQNNNFAAQTLTVSGNAQASTAVLASGSTAQEVATAINSLSSRTGVSASAQTQATLSNLSADGTVTFSLRGNTSNGNANISASVTTTDLTNLADAINAQSATTGIRAASTGGSLTLESVDGFDIAIQGFSNSAGGTQNFSFGTAAGSVTLQDDGLNNSATVGGQVSINATSGFTVSSDTGTTLITSSPATTTFNPFSSVDVSTQAGANSAISVIDFSIERVGQVRASIGAFQNRFESTLSANSAQAVNAVSARSTLQDADFAQELSSLTRSQILQQTSIALFAQANVSQRSVLSLLNLSISSNGS